MPSFFGMGSLSLLSFEWNPMMSPGDPLRRWDGIYSVDRLL